MLNEAQIADGWIEHDGGPCPVALDSPVEIMTKGGTVTKWARAGAVVWPYGSFIAEIAAPMPRHCEVRAYRPETPND